VPSLNIGSERGGQILAEAYRLGVNFWDTSDDYGSHPHIASALKRVPRKEVIISTKTWAKSGQEAEKSLKNSLRELETDYADVFMLHLVKSDRVDGCRQVLKELNNLKATGMIKTVGLSTHSVTVVRKTSTFNELDIVMTICCNASQATINRYPENIPLEDGSKEEMFHAIRLAHENGKGIIAMKVLGTAAPPLVKNYKSSIKTVAKLDFADTLVIGMKNLEDVKRNAQAILSS
jgi:aryl-alcohol dehydrogenase-like predicted oxidoreductase